MTFENMNTDDFFPLLQQTLSDTFKIDSYLMHAPYQNFEKMDMGLRRMVWGNYKNEQPTFFFVWQLSLSNHCTAEFPWVLQCNCQSDHGR